jgi:hypothetical protein
MQEQTHMSYLAKLTFKSVARTISHDPITARRDKLVAALKVQHAVLAAALEGQDHYTERSKWMVNAEGQRVLVKTRRRVRPWFFVQDQGWYLQCRYGARVISVDGSSNAVFAKNPKEVAVVLDALISAVKAGELDAVIAAVADRKTSTKAQRNE